MDIQVETHAGPHGDREPHAFLLGTRRLDVVTLIDRWIATDHSYFKLEASDGAIYILRLEQPTGQWTLTLFQAQDQAQDPRGE
jgi:hypothetical protein